MHTKNIRMRRILLGLSQAELARRIGKSMSWLSVGHIHAGFRQSWEGNPFMKLMPALSATLSFSLFHLYCLHKQRRETQTNFFDRRRTTHHDPSISTIFPARSTGPWVESRVYVT